MEKTVILILTGVLVLPTLLSCNSDEIDAYKVEDSAVVFSSASNSFSMKGVSDPEVTVSVPVELIGPVTDYDREIGLEVVDSELNTAEEGTDFEIVSSVIEAGALSGNIVLNITNNLDEETQSRFVFLRIVPNEYFREGYPYYSTSMISWSEAYVRPQEGVWRYWYLFFSRYYSRNLHELLVQEFGEEIEHVTNAKSYVNSDPTLEYKPISWWYAASRQFRKMVEDHDKAHPDEPYMHSDDCQLYNGYNQAAGNGDPQYPAPTILSTLIVY